jgi:DNA-binding NtrC family response regulator
MRKHVLLIDDKVELCNGLAELLRGEGYLVDFTSESRQGPVFLSRNNYDVCILDYTMQGLNGVDLLKMIKRDDPQCTVFIISGRTGIETLIQEERAAGLVAHVFTKPLDIGTLLQKVRSAIRDS